MIYLGNGLYSDSGPDTLSHYGVLGMKWGIRKDREFRRDLNWHEANKKIRANKLRQKEGSLSKADRKRIEKDIVRKTKAKNKAMKYDYADYKPKKGAKAREIYEKNMKRAQAEIPHYKTKHALRKAGKILGAATIAAAPLSGLSAGAGFAYGAGQLGADAIGYGIGYGAGQAAQGIAARKIAKRVARGRM